MIWPHQFRCLWELQLEGPLAASEIAENRPSSMYDVTGQGVANQLRSLLTAGFIAHDGGSPRIYHLTEIGKAYVEGDIETLAYAYMQQQEPAASHASAKEPA